MEKVQLSRLGRSEKGQAAVEFTITIMMTLMLIFALIDFSRAIYTASIIQWAAQQGAREAIVLVDAPQTDVEKQAAVELAVKDRLVGLDEDAVVVTPVVWTADLLEVTVTYPFEFVMPVVAQITGDSMEMSSSASMIAY